MQTGDLAQGRQGGRIDHEAETRKRTISWAESLRNRNCSEMSIIADPAQKVLLLGYERDWRSARGKYYEALFKAKGLPTLIAEGEVRIMNFDKAMRELPDPHAAQALYNCGGEALHGIGTR